MASPLLWTLQFQSTLPSQGATIYINEQYMVILISIHAPLTGSDIPCALTPAKLLYFNPRSPHRERRLPREDLLEVYYFNPRSPHRERRAAMVSPETTSRFQSTLPSQGATDSGSSFRGDNLISIHAPLTGSDITDVHR